MMSYFQSVADNSAADFLCMVLGVARSSGAVTDIMDLR
ncbi:hypothetical protein AGRO_3370 [Agrobacterium sp. ATCC 31749]|nr:hypothetical protein AGRO_3370 [Agrobacterium sp. ATCC 31749]